MNSNAPDIKAARRALDDLDDYARMGTSVNAIGPRGVLEAFINAVEAQRSTPSGEPIAYMRRWAFDGEKPHKVKGRWVPKFKFLPVTELKVMPDDVPLAAFAERAPVVGLSDEQIIEVAARVGSLSLHVTRMHEIGGKTSTIMDEAGVIEFARAILAAANGEQK